MPELLAPHLPPSSWRAASPYADGRSLGATNFVGIAGVGRDAARDTAADPQQARRMGVVGYDWGSRLEEITDGPANTIYLMTVPPTYPRPWVAGGGATVAGVDDSLPNPITDFAFPAPGRKTGAYALMADGSVRWIAADVDPKVFLGMATCAGGESLGDLDKAAPKDEPKPAAELKTDAPAAAPKEKGR